MKYYYTRTKIFHFKDRIDKLPHDSGVIPSPVHIRLKPTNICCHNCHYCAYSQKNFKSFGKDRASNDSIPRDKMLEIIEDIIEMDVKAVTFSGGGEPFVYPHLLDAVKLLARGSVSFASLTNGARLQGEIAEFFSVYATWVRVSIDGWDDESYTKFRGVPDGEFTKIISNMKSFINMKGKCVLGVSLIVGEHNVGHIYESLSKLKDIGISSVKVSPCLVGDDNKATNEYHGKIFKKVKSNIEKCTSKLSDSTFEISDSYNELSEKYEKVYDWCPHIQLRPVIGADLNVYTCPDKAYNLGDGLLGSIKNIRFKDFWFNGKDKFFKVNPSVSCCHHCELNPRNVLLWEYLNSDSEHLKFI
ncbi:MAG: radical SAM protein [Lentisphaerae bacterium GWF2_49_21]|nr:MAG: radical SAM protein [Lentisphaerae bacterium GWF2_49_21]